MRTAEDWIENLAEAYNCPDVAISETIKLIQLDAMQEGMRRAADMINNMDEDVGKIADNILTASDNLTPKNL